MKARTEKSNSSQSPKRQKVENHRSRTEEVSHRERKSINKDGLPSFFRPFDPDYYWEQ